MKTRMMASLVSLMMCLVAFSGCLQLDDEKGVISEELQSDLDRLSSASIPVDVVYEQGVEALGL